MRQKSTVGQLRHLQVLDAQALLDGRRVSVQASASSGERATLGRHATPRLQLVSHGR